MLSVPPTDGPHGRLQLHASTVVINNRAIAFSGPSGSGKSDAAVACVTRGGQLLADDVTWVHASMDGLIASCPPTISGRIEARGVGILNAAPAGPTRLQLIVDLGMLEVERLPDPKSITLLGHRVAVMQRPKTVHFIDAIVLYMMQTPFEDALVT